MDIICIFLNNWQLNSKKYKQKPMNSLKNYILEQPSPPLQFQQPEHLLTHIHQLLLQKDKTIASLSTQLTKHKSQSLKLTKTVQILQQKINKLSPNTNNTGSSFMMASEFKDHFDQFMKNLLPTVMSSMLEHPKAYAKYCGEFLECYYEGMREMLQGKVQRVCREILNVVPEEDNNCDKVKGCLLKVIQDNWQLFFNQTPVLKLPYTNQQIQDIQQSQQFNQMQTQLRKLCAYMILQQKPWKFMQTKEGEELHQFVKKQFVCIDGWIREGEPIMMVLPGIYRDGDNENQEIRHPNLKNYVIPYDELLEQQPYNFIIQQSINKPQQQHSKEPSYIQKGVQYQNLLMIIQPTNFQKQFKNNEQNLIESMTFIHNNPCLNNHQNQHKQNDSDRQIQNSTASFAKVQPLNLLQLDHIQNSALGSPMAPLKPIYLHNNNSSINMSSTRTKKQKTKISSSKNNARNKSKHGLVTDPSFQEILTMPKNKNTTNTVNNKRKNTDQLPLKRESSRIKKNNGNSRKSSVGKIVGQHVNHNNSNNVYVNVNPNFNEKFENLRCQKQNRNANLCKEVIYKDIIKQKLCENTNKTQRITLKQGNREIANTKDRMREEDRPLRIMHMKKIRDKYLNL